MCFDQVVCPSCLRYASELCKPRSRTPENACLRRPLVLLRQDLLPLKTWGGLPVALGDSKSPLPPSLYEPSGRVNLNSSLPFTGKLITKFLKSDEILSISKKNHSSERNGVCFDQVVCPSCLRYASELCKPRSRTQKMHVSGGPWSS